MNRGETGYQAFLNLIIHLSQEMQPYEVLDYRSLSKCCVSNYVSKLTHYIYAFPAYWNSDATIGKWFNITYHSQVLCSSCFNSS